MTPTFAVPPPPSHARWLLAGLLAIPAGIIVATMSPGLAKSDQAAAMPALAFGLVMIAAVAALAFWGLGRRAVELDGRSLRVKAAMFSHRVDASELELGNARIVDLDERIEYRPVLKTFGMALPGYQAGWFRLRDLSSGFCLLTSHRRVLWLPMRSGKSLLLSLERPESLLDALRQVPRPDVRHT
ncbi:hypothetical protein GCM10028795_01060 [Lysobacter olei]